MRTEQTAVKVTKAAVLVAGGIALGAAIAVGSHVHAGLVVVLLIVFVLWASER